MTEENQMSDKIVDLDTARPHITGLAICVDCSFRWVAVLLAESKRFDLECPRCGQALGVIIGGDNE